MVKLADKFCIYNSSPDLNEDGKTYPNECEALGDDIDGLACSSTGLNVHACVLRTYNDTDKNECYFKENQCRNATNDYTSINCADSPNRYACPKILTPNETCKWDTTSSSCSKIPLGACTAFTTGDLLYNSQVCASATGICKYNTETNLCEEISDTEELSSCTIPGLNKAACIDLTPESNSVKCQFDEKINQCIDLTNSDQNCATSFNKYACISLTKEPCYFNPTNKCTKFTISSNKLYENNIL